MNVEGVFFLFLQLLRLLAIKSTILNTGETCGWPTMQNSWWTQKRGTSHSICMESIDFQGKFPWVTKQLRTLGRVGEEFLNKLCIWELMNLIHFLLPFICASMHRKFENNHQKKMTLKIPQRIQDKKNRKMRYELRRRLGYFWGFNFNWNFPGETIKFDEDASLNHLVFLVNFFLFSQSFAHDHESYSSISFILLDKSFFCWTNNSTAQKIEEERK